MRQRRAGDLAVADFQIEVADRGELSEFFPKPITADGDRTIAGLPGGLAGKRRVHGQVADAGDLGNKDVLKRWQIALQFGCAKPG